MIDHDPDHPDSIERWIDCTLESLRSRIVARDAEIVRLRKALVGVVEGWESLPGGKNYGPKTIGTWLDLEMAPAVHGAYAALKGDS